MKLKFEKVSPDMEASFRCLEWDEPDFECPHHFHPEIEISEILAGSGERLVGDRFDTYEPGDIAMFGPNLPHRYRNWKSERSHSRVIQFLPEAFGMQFFDLPEFRAVRQLFRDSGRGVRFSEPVRKEAHKSITRLFKASVGPGRLSGLLDLLDVLSGDERRESMTSFDFLLPEKVEQNERLQRILNFVEERWQEKLTLNEVAEVACLHPQSLSRYFRQHLKKSFQEYLLELRLSRAARELFETSRAISEIAFDSGFNNLAHFNRSFLAHYQKTPRDYRSK